MTRKILVACAVLTCVFLMVALLQQDEELNGAATSFMERLQQEKSSEAFMYHQAFSAPTGHDPTKVAKATQAYSPASTRTISINTTTAELPLPSGDLFCSIYKDDYCLYTLFTHELDVDSIKQEHDELVSRYDKFLSFDEYSTLTKPDLDVEFPKYSFFFKAERIKILEAIEYHKKDQSLEAVNFLYNRIEKSRSMFKHQDTLIGKMVFLAILNNQVDVASLILSESGITAQPISLLSPEERDFSEVAAREFGYAYSATRSALVENRELEDNSWVVLELLEMALKTNMTVNASTPIYVRFEKLASLDFMDFSREMSQTPTPLKTSMIWNPIGYLILGELDASSFDKYVVRMFDFNAKLKLFNHKYHNKLNFEIAVNPYFKNEVSEMYTNEVCFRSFYKEKRVRCLQTAISPGQLATVDE